jgi:pimeloyl-ACP methyl ester carboxylesterase
VHRVLAQTPRVRSICVPAHRTAVAPTRMVWLPGAYHAAQDFVAAGFAEAVRTRRLALDLTFVDLELAHVGDRSALQRLRSELVLTARAEGVAIWLGGISLGGMFALDYAASHPDELDGLCLLAPYLGNRIVTSEIARAPGVAAWQPGDLAQIDEERRIWGYIKSRRADSRPLYLGFGRDDRFSAAHELLAATLPADSIDVIAGGHDWSTWSRLWENFLDARFK